ncbi:MAG: hydantoinase B/oxoprolinase family protein [Bdellovibrionales bacterium]|nr:hydantoinase B/oxoprolinase family protein [Bdellovibrionales bacterium]
MNEKFQASLLQSVFETYLEPFTAAAIIDNQGRALAIKAADLVDIGTFPTSAQLSDQYLQLQHGDIVLLNDPFSGGSHLSSMTLVKGFELPVSKSDKLKKLLICVRVPFRPRLGAGAKLEEEGVRVPPAPIFMNGELNKQLMEGLGQHPLCPESFEEFITREINLLQQRSDILSSQIRALGFELNDKSVGEFHALAHEKAKQALDEIAIGEAKVEQKFSKDVGKLTLQFTSTEKSLLFDFTGTTGSEVLNLTDNATFGACVGATYSVLDTVVPLNHGSLQAISVTTPKDTMVNTQKAKPIYMGLTDGPGVLASLVLKAIGQVDNRKQVAQSGLSQCSLEFVFADGSRYFDSTHVGLAATPDKPGVSGLDPWRRSHLNPSVEAAEKRFPVQVVSHNYRQKSGGSGLHQGGDGVTRKLKIQQDAELNWRIFDELKKNDGLSGGKTGTGPEVTLTSADGQITQLNKLGQIRVSAGSTVTINSAGGGGVGEVETE